MSEIFEIELEKKFVKVQILDLPNQRLFRIMLENKPPVVITRANHFNEKKFWTSIPEGRQKEAEKIGPLIEEYFKDHQ